jgi:hypothetical protein
LAHIVALPIGGPLWLNAAIAKNVSKRHSAYRHTVAKNQLEIHAKSLHAGGCCVGERHLGCQGCEHSHQDFVRP